MTIKDIVKQSWLCHPDWDVNTHLGYLFWEVVLPENKMPTEKQVAEWIASFGDHATALESELNRTWNPKIGDA